MTKPFDPLARRSALNALRERARSLEAQPQDIDELLRGIARPVGAGMNVRSRADVLHLIIDDPMLGGLRGGDGRRVDETAVRALVALGEPYVSELSPVGQRLLASAPPPPAPPRRVLEQPAVDGAGGSGSPSSWRPLAGPVLLAWGFYEVFMGSTSGGLLGSLRQLVALFTLIMPGLLICFRPVRESRGLYFFFTILELTAAPVLLLLGGASFLFMGSNSMNAQIGAFFQQMARSAGGALVIGIGLLIAGMTSSKSK